VRSFEQAWRTVVARHPVLRSSFHWQDSEKPLQVVHREVPLTIEKLDYAALSADEQQSQRDAYLEADRRRGFDFGAAPLFRLTLVRTGSEQHELLWTFPNLILDCWSVASRSRSSCRSTVRSTTAAPSSCVPLPGTGHTSRRTSNGMTIEPIGPTACAAALRPTARDRQRAASR